ncbi:MAG: DUF5696 domain-containing protein, partial [Candidatus Omnitrophica bacterium]|nr:DUF5696 domain-containing protein [Candidatus Omnitrophota bacterium]
MKMFKYYFRMVGLVFAALCVRALAGDITDLRVPLPPGETAITDIGLYRVGWQSYGKDPVQMPVSWMGHFDDYSGISYKPWGIVLGRDALLMHSPWRVPPGKTWADYQLELPRITPIRFSFGIAMGPDVATPDKSDGVTFSCYLIVQGKEHELMRQHQDKAEWKDYSFDFSPWAGQTVTLRLQVEPGPKNNASFDYSFFGDAKIAVGNAKATRAEMLKEFVSTRAYQAAQAMNQDATGAVPVASRPDLLNLSNCSANGVAPSNLLPCKNRLEQSGSDWHFIYEGPDCRLDYSYEPVTGTLDDFNVRADGGQPFQPAVGGGATAELKQDGKTRSLFLSGGKAIEIRRDGDRLRVFWEYDLSGKPVRLAWTFGISGKALTVDVTADKPVVTSFSLGETIAPLRRPFNVPYLIGQVFYLPVQGIFTCRYLDWTRSHASTCPQGTATYDSLTDGSRNTLVESGCVSVSPEIDEVLPNIPHPPSPFLATLGPNIMLDIWGHNRGTYVGDAENLRALKNLGVDHMVIIMHDWQRFGYDVKLPDHMPANPRYGGDAGMIEFGRTARECGYLWSLHENYIDLYPDAPSYDPSARVLLADGTPSKAWYNPGTKVQSFGLKCNRALGFAKKNSPEAHQRYGTTAAYLDVHTCVPPWHQLDHEAGQPMAGMELAKVKFDTELFQFERDTHGGPLFGEGANQFYWAGCCDGVEGQVAGGEDHVPFLDFDLLKLHPQMVNHGMGYYERWYRRGYGAVWGVDAGSPESLDKYRAQELAYGHAGFVGATLVNNIQHVWREHNLLHPVQRLYGTAKPVEIRYEVDGQFVSASAALIYGSTFRQRIRYDSGLTLWVNWDKALWTISNDKAQAAYESGLAKSGKSPASSSPLEDHPAPFVLPQWGWLAVGPGTLAGTFLVEDHVADYAECPEFIFADARTHLDTSRHVVRKDIEPRLRDFKWLGGDRVRVTYEWIVNETLDDDYHCFVHAVNSREPGSDHIVFQQDHSLPKSTRQWKKGE